MSTFNRFGFAAKKPVGKKKKSKVVAALLGALLLSGAGRGFAAEPISISTGIGVKATFYGFAWFDYIYTDNRSGSSNFTLFAQDQKNVKNDSETRLTASSTRLGFNFSGPEDAPAVATGKIEFDFFQTSPTAPSENSASIRLRQAYAAVSNKSKSFGVLAGQAWDVIAPLNPPTLDAGILFYGGNLGARRPQLRLTETAKIGDNGKFEIAVAAVRSIDESGVAVPAGQVGTGRSANAPGVEGRVGLSLPSWVEKQNFTIGVGGLYAPHQLFTNAGGNYNGSIELQSRAVAVDLELPILPQASLAAEGWQGSGLGSYSGNNGYDFYTPTNATITQVQAYKGRGGWAALRAKFDAAWSGNVGVGYDRLTNDQKYVPTTTPPRYQNVTAFANVWFAVTSATKFGAEYGHTRTSYVKDGDAALNRGQLSVVYNF